MAQIIYNHETSNLPTFTFELLSRRTGSAVDISGKTVTFEMYGRNAITACREHVASIACTITDGLSGKGEFTFTTASVATPGDYDGYVKVNGGAGQIQIFPSRNSIETKISEL